MRVFILGFVGVVGGLLMGSPAMAQNSASDEEVSAGIQQSTETETLDSSMIMVAPTQEVSPSDPSLAIPVDDPEALKARIRQLKEQNQALAEERNALAGERDALAAKINEMTALGGSLVTAYCASREISRNTAGAEEDCSTVGYVCDPVSGLCHTTCQGTDHCASGYACDVEAGRCIPAG